MSYKEMYYKIFNRVTDLEQQLLALAAEARLIQQECEDIFIESKDPLQFHSMRDKSQKN